jgi:hypothetical protein
MRILLYPESKLVHFAKLKYYIERNGYEVVSDPKEPHDKAIWWCYDTFRELDETARELNLINRGGHDASKRKVERVMKEVFGYNSLIYDGEVYIKSNSQGAHEGEVKEGLICKLIDNEMDGYYIDHRLFIFGKKIVLLWISGKLKAQRFGGHTKSVYNTVTKDIGRFFSTEEQAKIIEFMDVYGLDFSELDILRDKDGRIYIVDQNNISGMMTSEHFKDVDEREFMDFLAREFKNFIE